MHRTNPGLRANGRFRASLAETEVSVWSNQSGRWDLLFINQGKFQYLSLFLLGAFSSWNASESSNQFLGGNF
jgi:hypothetical protein